MLDMYHHPSIKGFTTNPTLMRKAGIADYQAFAHSFVRPFPTARYRSKSSRTIWPKWSAKRFVIAPWGRDAFPSRSR